MKLFVMEGFLRGKCLPDDMKVNETNAEYLVRKFAEAESKCAALAAENGQMLRLLTDISENHDEYVNQDEYLYAGVPMDYVSEINAYVSRDVEAENPFKATDAFLAEVRASAIPEGYVLVPQEMHLSSEAMEGICFHCGDGDHKFGEFTDGTLFVGEVDYGDGKKVHGLHIATADYPEEGCATICEFAAQLRKGVQS